MVDEVGRVERIPYELYELCVLVSLRDALRRRDIRVPGAGRWQNPEDNLPPDFEATARSASRRAPERSSGPEEAAAGVP
ncbi:hypothetical protein [Streptomyces sp. NPDC044948]|uniref:hypothetical protein n=1 Tax=Streptomyces sp. NPDC044948 TaxID=3157092 RepID=UPI00336D6855